MSKPKFDKFYFPGLISLVLLPLLCIFYFLNNHYFDKQYGIKANWCNDAVIKSALVNRNEKFDVNTFRIFESNLLTGNEENDRAVLNLFEQNIKKLASLKDTVNGYCIVFTRHTKYQDIVKSIDICSQNENIGYIFYKNKVMAWNGKPDEYSITHSSPHLIDMPL